MATISFGLFLHLDLPEDEALARRKGGDHVNRRLGAFLLVRAAQRLAVDGNDIGGNTDQSGTSTSSSTISW